jgi:acyl transferase domain-containing protein
MSAPVAVVGMALRVPGASSVGEFQRLLRAGRECLTFYDQQELRAAGVPAGLLERPDYVRAGGGVLPGVEQFDAAFFGIDDQEAELTDPQHRLFLELAWEALENAGHAGPDSRRAGVFAGAGLSRYGPVLLDPLGAGMPPHEFRAAVENDKDFLTTRVAYRLDLRGPVVSVQAGSATSLAAVHLACRSLRAGDCDLALAGGVSVIVGQQPGEPRGYLYQPGGLASPDGRCRPFQRGSAGTVRGDGLGLVVLRRLADALADGDTIHALILGSAIVADGARGVGFGAPSADGYAEAVRAALAEARAVPETIGMVEAHGIGAPLADAVEVAALTAALGGARRGPCALGSVKANIGHLNTAAGVAALVKAVLAVRDGEVPPLAGGGEPSPLLRLEEGPFFLPLAPSPWPVSSGRRRAGVSAFGGGGTHVHMVVEEPPPPRRRVLPRDRELLALSAASRQALTRSAGELAAFLRGGADLADVAHTLRVGRRKFPCRLAVVAADAAQAAGQLERLAPSGPPEPDPGSAPGAGRIALPAYPLERRPYWRSPVLDPRGAPYVR